MALGSAQPEEFWKNVRVLGINEEFNQSLEKTGRVADFFELPELKCLDALDRKESCGGHFREEYQSPEGDALRDDEKYSYVAAWDYQGDALVQQMNIEGVASCTKIGECEAACPKRIRLEVIARTNRDYLKAAFLGTPGTHKRR